MKEFFKLLGKNIRDIIVTFSDGDWRTKASFVIMGFGQIARRQYVKGFAFLLSEIGIIYYVIQFGGTYLKKFSTLGTRERGFNPNGTINYGDNSFFILLYGLLTIIILILFTYLWYANIKQNREINRKLANEEKLETNREFINSLLNQNFEKTLLAAPVLGIFLFTVIPILFMICVAFTNYDYSHQAPSKLFTWVGFENFRNLFSFGTAGIGNTFITVLGWTIIWAFFATFLNYFLGIAVAMLINKKGIRLKKVWRTILVFTIAVPQFVSLLFVCKMFAADGIVNTYLLKWGLIQKALPFWTDKTWARITILLINLWIGIPYMMLISTGLLMNIPEELYESAHIDGANKFQMFQKITLPYMLFITGPFLLTQFTGNLNNFNVIYLLTQGGPKSLELSNGAGYTDLLVTWLYKLTINDSNYKMAAVLGIMVFLVTAVISLIVYNLIPSVKEEEGFQ